MEEEFQESDIVFSDELDPDADEEEEVPANYIHSASGVDSTPRKKMRRGWSAAVNIPRSAVLEFDVVEEDGEMVPPHMIIARRIAEEIAGSLYAHGMTFEGRNPCRFRNSVLRLTGFIEC
ncbi:hypothetical protein Dimus_021976 [Dionaea muscipula]